MKKLLILLMTLFSYMNSYGITVMASSGHDSVIEFQDFVAIASWLEKHSQSLKESDRDWILSNADSLRTKLQRRMEKPFTLMCCALALPSIGAVACLVKPLVDENPRMMIPGVIGATFYSGIGYLIYQIFLHATRDTREQIEACDKIESLLSPVISNIDADDNLIDA